MSDNRKHTIKFSYRSVPTLKTFSEDPSFIRGVMGPFGSGKSSACVIELVSKALAQKPGPDGIRRTRWAVIRNTYRQLHDTTWKTFQDWIPIHIFGKYTAHTNTYVITEFEKTHIEVIFRALDRPDHIGNLLSLELTGAWVNEAREVPWSIIDALMGRVGRYPPIRDGGCTWSGVFLDTNPPETDSKWYKYFEETEHPPGQAAIFKQPSGLGDEAENLDNLPSNYYTRLASGKDPSWIDVYVKGLYGFTIDGRVVFPQFLDYVHVSENIKPVSYEPIIRGWDFGLTPACVFCQVTPTGQFIVFDEMTSEDMGVFQFSDDVLQYSSQMYHDYEFQDVGDPAGGQRAQTDEKTCFQILHSKGIYIEPGMQSIAIRLESVNKPLTSLTRGKPMFQLHPRCKVLRKAFNGGYVYRRLHTTQERYTDAPDKNKYSHPMDALQYAATMVFGGGLTAPYSRPGSEDDGGFDFSNRNEMTGY